MPKYKPLNYREVITVLRNLGFSQATLRSTSHQTWTAKINNKYFAVTVPFHGLNIEFKPGTLNSIIRQSGFSKEDFYRALKKPKAGQRQK